MPADFTPFFPGIRSKLASAGAASGTQFAPVTASASNPAASNLSGNGGQTPHTHTDPKVEIKRDGDRISQIRIQCACGEVIEVDCEY